MFACKLDSACGSFTQRSLLYGENRNNPTAVGEYVLYANKILFNFSPEISALCNAALLKVGFGFENDTQSFSTLKMTAGEGGICLNFLIF